MSSATASKVFSTDELRWAALVARDAAADGEFFYSVRSTGVYCRPSCGARQPLRRNVQFHADSAAAQAAGFRPCKRCKPDNASLPSRQAALVAEACRIIEASETPPSLNALADRLAVSPHHFHKVFKAVAGITPKAYADAHRAQRLRQELNRGATVTEAIYGAGFNSSGRFYSSAGKLLGMPARAVQAGGANQRIRFAAGDCSLGAIVVAATEKGVCAILLGDDPELLVRDLQDRFPSADFVGDDPQFAEWVAQVIGFVDNPAPRFSLPLDVRGTAFQQRVWQALTEIPVGSTATYAEVAAKIGAPQASRAVAQACAANKIAVAIPCHRVIRQDGSISGYRWGVERKRTLLAKEKVIREKLRP